MPRVKMIDYRKHDFVDLIKIKMVLGKVNQTNLAKAIGCEQSTISKKLANGNFTFDEFLKIIDYLKFSNSDIIKITQKGE